ncbi:hypothetical protein K0M31_017912 [Melipona bicolor]|uniref:Uncharacterized protein n=1 Tax=Melipona bicolor TaxID=60889 RepID=A0AA40KT47_9HYME|nr:hypothetical protein K0M31_017912 [Melipona bicolor]
MSRARALEIKGLHCRLRNHVSPLRNLTFLDYTDFYTFLFSVPGWNLNRVRRCIACETIYKRPLSQHLANETSRYLDSVSLDIFMETRGCIKIRGSIICHREKGREGQREQIN